MKVIKKMSISFWKLKTITFCVLVFSISGIGQTDDNKPNDFDALKKVSIEELQVKTQAHDKLWGLGKVSRWDLLQDNGNLIFSFADGFKAVAPAQIIGTYNSKEGMWLWAWNNPSVVEALKKDALKVREYGEKNGIEQLTKPKWSGTEEDAWAMTAVAVKLCDAQGAYRGPASPTLFVFMTFGEVQLSKKQ